MSKQTKIPTNLSPQKGSRRRYISSETTQALLSTLPLILQRNPSRTTVTYKPRQPNKQGNPNLDYDYYLPEDSYQEFQKVKANSKIRNKLFQPKKKDNFETIKSIYEDLSVERRKLELKHQNNEISRKNSVSFIKKQLCSVLLNKSISKSYLSPLKIKVCLEEADKTGTNSVNLKQTDFRKTEKKEINFQEKETSLEKMVVDKNLAFLFSGNSDLENNKIFHQKSQNISRNRIDKLVQAPLKKNPPLRSQFPEFLIGANSPESDKFDNKVLQEYHFYCKKKLILESLNLTAQTNLDISFSQLFQMHKEILKVHEILKEKVIGENIQIEQKKQIKREMMTSLKLEEEKHNPFLLSQFEIKRINLDNQWSSLKRMRDIASENLEIQKNEIESKLQSQNYAIKKEADFKETVFRNQIDFLKEENGTLQFKIKSESYKIKEIEDSLFDGFETQISKIEIQNDLEFQKEISFFQFEIIKSKKEINKNKTKITEVLENLDFLEHNFSECVLKLRNINYSENRSSVEAQHELNVKTLYNQKVSARLISLMSQKKNLQTVLEKHEKKKNRNFEKEIDSLLKIKKEKEEKLIKTKEKFQYYCHLKKNMKAEFLRVLEKFESEKEFNKNTAGNSNEKLKRCIFYDNIDENSMGHSFGSSK